MKAIEVTGLTTRFGDRVIHKSIAFNVKEGEIFMIIGSSGAGKSTLLKELILLLRPQDGSIKVFGSDILSLKSKEIKEFSKNLGVLFQSSALFSSLTVGENIALVLKEYTRLSEKTIDELVRYKLSLVGLEPFVADLYPSELSGGMKKRAALARALALEPRLLFLDEPTSGLDPISSRAFDELIMSLKKSLGITFVIVSHDVHSVRDISDTLMALHAGDIVFCGSVSDGISSAHPFLKSFFDMK